MTAIIRNSFRVHNARKFISSLDGVTPSDTLYLGIGRPQQWPNADNAEVPANTVKGELTDWADMMFLKRLSKSNISHAIPKKIWAANSFYDVYRHDWNGYITDPLKNIVPSSIKNNGVTEYPTDISQVKFYCISPTSNKVYICLRTGVDATNTPTASIVNPDYGTMTVPGTSHSTTSATNITYCSDGYVWLLVGDSTDLVDQFETVDYYPVQTAVSSDTGNSLSQYNWQLDSAAFKGGIYSFIVNPLGTSGFTNNGPFEITNDSPASYATHIQVIGDGTGLKFSVLYTSGAISRIIVTNPGSGYTWARVVIHNSGGVINDNSVTPVLTPLYGIGVDPVKTLCAYSVIVQTLLYDDDADTASSVTHGVDITVDNDYRKVCLVSSPLKQNGTLCDLEKVDMTTGLVSSTSSSVPAPNTIIDLVDSRVRVVDGGIPSGGGSTLTRVIQTEYDCLNKTTPNTNITAGTWGAFVASSILQPGAIIGSGDIIYVDYRRSVARAPNQSEEFKIVIEF